MDLQTSPSIFGGTRVHTQWVWRLHGELIDYALETMAGDPDSKHSNVKFEHYKEAIRLANAFYNRLYPSTHTV